MDVRRLIANLEQQNPTDGVELDVTEDHTVFRNVVSGHVIADLKCGRKEAEPEGLDYGSQARRT